MYIVYTLYAGSHIILISCRQVAAVLPIVQSIPVQFPSTIVYKLYRCLSCLRLPSTCTCTCTCTVLSRHMCMYMYSARVQASIGTPLPSGCMYILCTMPFSDRQLYTCSMTCLPACCSMRLQGPVLHPSAVHLFLRGREEVCDPTLVCTAGRLNRTMYWCTSSMVP